MFSKNKKLKRNVFWGFDFEKYFEIHLACENRFRVATWSLGNQETQIDSPKWIKGTGPSLPKNLVRGFGMREEGALAKTKAPSTHLAL